MCRRIQEEAARYLFLVQIATEDPSYEPPRSTLSQGFPWSEPSEGFPWLAGSEEYDLQLFLIDFPFSEAHSPRPNPHLHSSDLERILPFFIKALGHEYWKSAKAPRRPLGISVVTRSWSPSSTRWKIVIHVRKAAAKALGKIGGDKVLEFLIHALEDSDSDVRKASAKALEKSVGTRW